MEIGGRRGEERGQEKGKREEREKNTPLLHPLARNASCFSPCVRTIVTLHARTSRTLTHVRDSIIFQPESILLIRQREEL